MLRNDSGFVNWPDGVCAVCGKQGTWCQISADGKTASCKRRQDGCYSEGENASGAYYLHKLVDDDQEDEGDDRAKAPRKPNGKPKERAAPATVSAVYAALLGLLTINPRHREQLLARGLRDADIDRAEYRSMPSYNNRPLKVSPLLDKFGEKDLLAVPGLYKSEEGTLTLAGSAGLLIPCRDVQGRVQGLQVRADDPGDGAKYTWLSSTGHGGPGPGAPPHFPMPRTANGRTLTNRLRLTEGPLKADIATALSPFYTVACCGVSTWRAALSQLVEFGATKIRLAFDADATSNAHVAGALLGCARAAVAAGLELLLETWSADDGKGIDDVLAAGGEVTTFTGDEATAEAGRIAAAAGYVEDNRPEIVISTEMMRVNDQAIDALAASGGLYQRGRQLVRLTTPPADDERQGIKRHGTPKIEPLPVPLLHERLSASARWVSEKGKPSLPPHWSVSAVNARGEWPGIPHLHAIVDHPVLLPDGTVLATPGYDEASGILHVPPPDGILSLPDPFDPTLSDARRAVKELNEVVVDFPFEKPAHRAAWFASLLTPLARFAFDGYAPLFLVEANMKGTGKGLLVNATSCIVTGREFTVAVYTENEEELRKRITALAIAGDRMILFDNLEGKFGNATLNAALTATAWKDRVLGHSRIVEVPLMASWYATGNNASVNEETLRRCCHVLLMSELEHPEERTGFRYPQLLEWVGRERPRLLTAALTILRGYHVAGRPDQNLTPWGGFGPWSRLVRSAIVWAGLPDPGETRRELRDRAGDTGAAHAQLLRAWERLDPDRQGITATEMIRMVYRERAGGFSSGKPEEKGKEAALKDMRSALESLFDRPDAHKLGRKLRSFRRQTRDGRCFDQTGVNGRENVNRWAVYPAKRSSDA
jgi:hypothetical protein